MSAEKLSFAEAIKICLRKFFDFRGLASRREFWYFMLFTFLVSIVFSTIDEIIFAQSTVATDLVLRGLEANPPVFDVEQMRAAIAEDVENHPISNLLALILLIPGFTAMVRRMRDAGFGAWWLLLSWLPGFTLVLTVLPTKRRLV